MPNPCAGVPANAFCNQDLTQSTRAVAFRTSYGALPVLAELGAIVAAAGLVARRRRRSPIG